MKYLLSTILALGLASTAFAQGGQGKKKQPSPEYKAAKQACLKKDPQLKGKKLQSCIKERRAKKS